MLDPGLKRIDQQWIDAIAAPLLILDVDSTIIAINAACARLTASQPKQVEGKLLDQTTLIPDIGQRLMQATAPDQFPITSQQLYHHAGSSVLLKWSVNPIYDDNQALVYYAVTGERLPTPPASLPAEAPLLKATYYQQIIWKTPNGVYILNGEGLIIEWNPANELITGLERDKVLGKPLWEVLAQLTPPEARQATPTHVLKGDVMRVFDAPASDTQAPYDMPIVCPDGSQRVLQIFTFRLDNTDEEMACGIVRDVSAHRQMEEDLRASEHHYQLLVNNLPNVGVMLYDHDLRFSVVAGKALAGLNIEPGKVRGKTLYDISSGDPDQGLRFYQSALRGETIQFEYEHANRSYELHILPVRDGEQITGGMVLAIDITQRKAAEWALRNSEERYRLLIDSMQEGMMVFSENGRITYVNDKMIEITGYSRDTLLDESVVRLLAREARETVIQEMRHIQQGESRIFEQPFRRRDDSIGYVIVAASPLLDDKGYFRGGFIVMTDITERKEMEDALRQSNDELDAFAHTVAHDLKNPLSTAQGFANLLQDIKDELKTEELSEYLEHIQQSNDRMMNIIDELLLLAEMRHTEVTMVLVDMPPLVESAIQRLDYMISFQQPIIKTGDMSAWHPVVGYPAWIEEIWTNYISNAIKYGGKPAEIQLGAELVADGEQVRFWVQDNGVGVPPDKRDQLFMAFKRFDRIRAEGHGLGLSIVKRIANLLGGEVGYEFLEGVGSRFYFTLPAYQPEAETEAGA